MERAALAEALCGNMSTHVVYAVREARCAGRAGRHRAGAVPVLREMPGAELAKHIRPDGTLPILFDGLRVPVPLPPLAAAILRLVDGHAASARSGAQLAGRVGPEAFARAWRDTYAPLSALNRLLLAPPP